MKTKNILIAILFLAGLQFFAQDQLFKKDNSKHEVKVLEVTTTEIKYKLKSNLDGPLYVINKNEVALIIYQNGEHETYPDAKPTPQQTVIIQSPFARYDSIKAQNKREKEKDYLKLTTKKNVVLINALAILNGAVSLSYLREFGKGLFSFQVPFSFSFSEPVAQNIYGVSSNFYYNSVFNFKITRKAFDTGFGIYFHTSGKRAVTHFIGPMIRFSQYNGTFQAYEYTVDQYGYTYYSQSSRTHGFVLNETYALINNGLMFRVTPSFNMMLHIAVGAIVDRHFVANDPKNFNGPNNYYYTSNPYNAPIFNFGFSAGYRF